MKAIRSLVAVALFLNASGCGPQTLRAYRNGVVGRPIGFIRKLDAHEGSYAQSISWKETTYQLDNDNWVYVQPIKPNCSVHWEVNQQGMIVASRAEGTGCDMWPFR